MFLAVKIWFTCGVVLFVMAGIGAATVTNQGFQSWWGPMFLVLAMVWIASALIGAAVWVWRDFQ